MQIILVSRHLKAARTVTIMPRHLAMAALALSVLIIATSALFSWLSVHLRLPLVEDLVLSLQHRETQKTREYLANNLNLMASRVGELEARVLQLDTLGQRISGLAGLKQEKLPAVDSRKPGEGGPFIAGPMAARELQLEIERLSKHLDKQSDDLTLLESRLLERKVADRLLPTNRPVAGGVLGSGFGYRVDPINGIRAMHEGLDFAVPTGTPVVAAADGVVLTAMQHPDFGNMIDIDHGNGLTSRYAHLSKIDVAVGQMVKRGQLIGVSGSTGRSTGPHLHFEVRMNGVAEDPAPFLRQGTALARLAKR